MWGEPPIKPTRSRRSRLTLSVALVLALGLVGVPAVHPVGAAEGWDYAGERDALLGQLPAEPTAAAMVLVDGIYGDDGSVATMAAMELLRRAGLPLVNLGGNVAALPDDLVLIDAGIPGEFVPTLVRSVRAGDYYTIEELNNLLFDSGLFTEPLALDVLTGALGAWGKPLTDPAFDPAAESITAGAAVRALGARRGQVYYSGALLPDDPSTVTVDLLQLTLIFSHLAGRTVRLEAPSGLSVLERLLGLGEARAAGLAANCEEALIFYEEMEKPPEGLDKQLYEFLLEALKEASGFDTSIPKPSDLLGISGKASSVMTTLLWLAGIRLKLTADPRKTHFRHSAGAGGDVTVEAYAHFKFPGLDTGLSEQAVNCLKLLTDVEAFPDGPLSGFKVRWSMNQPAASSGRIQEGGKLLRPKGAASEAAFNPNAGGGTTTLPNGTSTVVLETAVERTPEAGALNTGRATIIASLDKEDMPLKLKDLVGLVNPTKFAIDKLFDLANSAIRRLGLPKQQVDVTVEYHGSDIYVIEGRTTLFVLWYFLPIKLALYTCDGLKGRWHGTSGFDADLNFLGDIANSISPILRLPQLPASSEGEVSEDFLLDLTDGFDRANILLGFGLDVSVDPRPPMTLNKTIEMTAGRGYVVGDAELTISGQSVGPLAVFDGRSAIFDVKRYRPGERQDLCPGTEADSYFP